LRSPRIIRAHPSLTFQPPIEPMNQLLFATFETLEDSPALIRLGLVA